MNATQSKADLVRERLDEIASLRMDGTTWPVIALHLSLTGINVSGDEIRAYWGRFSGGKHPAEILVERSAVRARDAERRLAEATEIIRKLDAGLKYWDDIAARVATAHKARDNQAMMVEIEAITALHDRQQQ